MKSEWLNDGSIFILIPETLFPFWGNTETDYERACLLAKTWLATIQIENEIGLLFGGDPAMATFIRDGDNNLLLVKWIYADNEDDLLALARQGKHVVAEERPIYLTNTQSNWALFDAVYDADNEEDAPELLKIVMPLGKLKIQSQYLEQGTTAAIVHKFSQCN